MRRKLTLFFILLGVTVVGFGMWVQPTSATYSQFVGADPETQTETSTEPATATETSTFEGTPTLTATATLTPTDTVLPATATSTNTATSTSTDTVLPATTTPTSTATGTPTATTTPTNTATGTATPTLTASAISTATTTSATPTTTATPSSTIMPTGTTMASATATSTLTASAIPTATATPTLLPTATSTAGPSLAFLPLVVVSPPTPTATPTPMATATPTATVAPLPTATTTQTPPPATATTSPATPTSTSIPTQTIVNGSFEAGTAGWTEYSALGYQIIGTTFPGDLRPHSGTWAVWLGGGDNETSSISQPITVEASQPYLSYWYWIASEDICSADVGGVAIDYGGAQPDIVDSYYLCSSTNTGGWVRRTVNLSSYVGRSVTLIILAGTDASLNSNLFIDDVALQSQAAVTANDGLSGPLSNGATRPKSTLLHRNSGLDVYPVSGCANGVFMLDFSTSSLITWPAGNYDPILRPFLVCKPK